MSFSVAQRGVDATDASGTGTVSLQAQVISSLPYTSYVGTYLIYEYATELHKAPGVRKLFCWLMLDAVVTEKVPAPTPQASRLADCVPRMQFISTRSDSPLLHEIKWAQSGSDKLMESFAVLFSCSRGEIKLNLFQHRLWSFDRYSSMRFHRQVVYLICQTTQSKSFR